MDTMPPVETIDRIRRQSLRGFSDGRESPGTLKYLRDCTWFHWHTGTQILYTRDIGHHSSGWMKNPDYERAKHLSLSFRIPFPQEPIERVSPIGAVVMTLPPGGFIPNLPFDRKLARPWVTALLREDERYAWHESPFSDIGKALQVEHWRVLCDPRWNAIIPRGEVYSREHTERGWKSWSEVQGEDAAPNWVSAE